MPPKKTAAPKAEAPPKPDHVVAGETFIWNSPDPEVGEVRIPLKFKTKILRAAKDMQDDELGFMFYVLDNVAGDAVSQVDEMDAGEMKTMFREWQLAWQERSEATFPESSRSSA